MRDYLTEVDRIFQVGDPLAGILPTRTNTWRGIYQVDAESGRELLVQLLSGGNGGHRKIAAFAIAQLGEEALLEALRQRRAEEGSQGCIDAMDAAIATLQRLPASAGSTEEERSSLVTSLYYPSTGGQQPALPQGSAERKGFLRRLFGG